MAKWFHPDVLDNGLNEIKNNAERVAVIKAYAAGDSYATVTGNIVAHAATVPTDYTLGNQATTGRQVTTPAKTPNASASSQAGDNLHFAYLDDTGSRVLAVTDETTDQPITSGNQVNIPSLALKMNQPV
jgi:hypothetical protein